MPAEELEGEPPVPALPGSQRREQCPTAKRASWCRGWRAHPMPATAYRLRPAAGSSPSAESASWAPRPWKQPVTPLRFPHSRPATAARAPWSGWEPAPPWRQRLE